MRSVSDLARDAPQEAISPPYSPYVTSSDDEGAVLVQDRVCSRRAPTTKAMASLPRCRQGTTPTGPPSGGDAVQQGC
jgi:hypothetical protein